MELHQAKTIHFLAVPLFDPYNASAHVTMVILLSLLPTPFLSPS